MKRKVIGGLVVGFIVLLALSIVSFFVGFGAFKYIMYPLLVLNLIALIYIILKRFIGERKLIIFLVPLTIILIILVIMVLIQLPLFTDFDKDLVLAMDFDHIEGDKVLDTSEFGNNGTIYGANVVKGVKGNALEFDGVDDYVEINTTNFPSEFPNGLTISFWMEGYNLTGDKRESPISRLNENQFFIYSRNNNQELVIGSFSKETEIARSCKIWKKNHITVVLHKNIKVIINGKVCFEDRRLIDLNSSNANIFLGKYYNDNNFFNGRIDQISIYRNSFTTKELKILYLKEKISIY